MKTTLRLNVVNHHFHLHSAQSTYILSRFFFQLCHPDAREGVDISA